MSAPRLAERSGERSSGARGRYRSTTLRAATISATVGSRCTARRYFAAEMRTWGEERDGAVAVAIAAHERSVHVIATDISTDALVVARENTLRNGVADRVELREGDLLTPIVDAVDLVVANLPYLRDDTLEHLVGERTSLAFEPRLAVTAGKDGLELIWRAAADLQ